MNAYLFLGWTCLAAIAMSFWESYVEGRNAWHNGKHGWKFHVAGYAVTGYHFWLFWVMWPLVLTLPLALYGWDAEVFGIALSAYALMTIVEDFFWYVVNPKVRLREFWTPFSDYYPWIRIAGKKILPVGYVVAAIIGILSWYFLWG